MGAHPFFNFSLFEKRFPPSFFGFVLCFLGKNHHKRVVFSWPNAAVAQVALKLFGFIPFGFGSNGGWLKSVQTLSPCFAFVTLLC